LIKALPPDDPQLAQYREALARLQKPKADAR
jgi:hypothetical protein